MGRHAGGQSLNPVSADGIATMTTERMNGTDAQRSAPPALAATLDQGQQLRLLATLSAQLDLGSLIAALPVAFAEIVRVDGVRYRSPDGEDIRVGRRARHSIEYRLLPSPDDSLGIVTFHRGSVFKEAELARVEAAMPLLMLSLRNALAYRAALASALTDPLTGIGNRAAMQSSGWSQIELAHRHELPLSLLLIDIDHFKRINDTYGHAKGDAVLKLLARTVARATRRSDHVFRYGGEEFVVLLGHTDLAGAEIMAERIRILVAGSRDLHREIEEGVTVSVGVGTLRAQDTLETLCERADRALYLAKRGGRNRVVAPVEELSADDAREGAPSESLPAAQGA
jgi:diguanylate cyclase (GGDEF)-like protein